MCEMAQPIYKVALVNYTNAFYELSPDERDKLGAKVEQALKEAGGERIVVCTSAWCSENYGGWVVEKFPDIESVQKFTQLLWEFDWYRYIEVNSYLGIEYTG
jgi:hypothetical protein